MPANRAGYLRTPESRRDVSASRQRRAPVEFASSSAKTNLKQHLEGLISTALQQLRATGLPLPDHAPAIEIERARSKEHGDFASNVALGLAKVAGAKPRDLATRIVAA